MGSLWIIHREEKQRKKLADWCADQRPSLLGKPDGQSNEAKSSPEVVLLGVGDQPEQELEFAHRTNQRFPGCSWLVLANPAIHPWLQKLLHGAQILFLSDQATANEIQTAISSLRQSRLQLESLAERKQRDRLSIEFQACFDQDDIEGLLEALNPKLALRKTPILLYGPKGCYAELVARYLHHFSGGRGEFFAMNHRALTLHALCDALKQQCNVAPPGALFIAAADERSSLEQEQLLNWIRWEATAPLSETRLFLALHNQSNIFDETQLLNFDSLHLRIPEIHQRRGGLQKVIQRRLAAWESRSQETPPLLEEADYQHLEAHPWQFDDAELDAILKGMKKPKSAERSTPLQAEEVSSPETIAFSRGESEVSSNDFEAFAKNANLDEVPSNSQQTTGDPSDSNPRDRLESTSPKRIKSDPEDTPLESSYLLDHQQDLLQALKREITEPLDAMRTFSNLFAEHFDDADFRQRSTPQMREQLSKLESLLQHLTTFAAAVKGSTKKIDISDLLDQLLEAERPRIESQRLVVLKELERESPYIETHEALVKPALAWILSQILDLLPDEGDLYLASRSHGDKSEQTRSTRLLFRARSKHPQLRASASYGRSIFEAFSRMALARILLENAGCQITAKHDSAQSLIIVVDLPAPLSVQ